ncbi:MAG: response regulator [Pirellulales bacterium]
MTIKLLIADDHPMVRVGLKALFEGTDIKVVAEASTGQEALRLALSKKIDVALLDVRMPDGDGLNALGRIKLEKPDLPVLLLSTYDNPSYIARAVALGASGYLLKGTRREALIKAIETAAIGETIWPRAQLRRLTGALGTPRSTADIEVSLTRRESDVLRQIALGSTNEVIAKDLNISCDTVKEHVQNILRKIGVTDRTQAAVWAVRKGLA